MTELMQLSMDQNRGVYYIRSYEPGILKINDLIIDHSIVLTPDEMIDPWPPQTFSDLSEEVLQPILLLQPEVFILGTGEKQHFPAPQLLNPFYQHRIGVEIMDTGAACRTYNILISEGRRVIAGLLIV